MVYVTILESILLEWIKFHKKNKITNEGEKRKQVSYQKTCIWSDGNGDIDNPHGWQWQIREARLTLIGYNGKTIPQKSEVSYAHKHIHMSHKMTGQRLV